MKAKFFFIALIAIACIACKPVNQPLVVPTLDEIFTQDNRIIRDYAYPILTFYECEKCAKATHKNRNEWLNAHGILEVIGSQEELLALCPEGVQPPELDFNECCIVWACCTTSSSRNEVTEAYLEDLDNGEYCFHFNVEVRSIDCAIGYAFPYVVYPAPKQQIKHIFMKYI